MCLLAQTHPASSQEMRDLQLYHSHQLCGIVAHVKDRSVQHLNRVVYVMLTIFQRCCQRRSSLPRHSSGMPRGPTRAGGSPADSRQDPQRDWLACGLSPYRTQRQVGLAQRRSVPRATARNGHPRPSICHAKLSIPATSDIASARSARSTRSPCAPGQAAAARDREPNTANGGFLSPDAPLPEPLCGA